MLKKIVIGMLLLTLSTAVFGGPDQAILDKGKKVYDSYCFTCHQPNGQGLPGAFPPLAKSDYLTKNDKKTVIKSVVFGLSGPLVVNGQTYNSVMTPIPPNYTDEDIAAVLTYVYNSWGNPGGVITPEEVKAAKAEGK
jgi:nitrite reductase (NO-forming)